jgi:hypothetical protein
VPPNGTGRATPKDISTLKVFNLIERWNDNKTVYRTLCLWACDTLSVPTMATECERAFSNAKTLISLELSDLRVFINRRSGLRLELVRWKEDTELLVLLPEGKGTSIYSRSSLLAT